MSSPPVSQAERTRLRHAIEHVAHLLPAQAPLEVFVHHNTLHAFQHLPFHEAVARAQQKLGVRGYLPEETYRDALESGRITEADLDAVFAEEGFSHAPLATGFPAIKTVARLVTRHGIGATTPAGLHWQLVENEATATWHEHVPANVRSAIVSATDAWLAPRLARLDPDDQERLARLIVGKPEFRSPVAELTALLGDKIRPEAFSAARERVALRALWTACVDACAHHEGRVPPEQRPPEFHRELLLACTNEDPNDLVHPTLIPVCAAFLDRGLSQWTMPDREHGFFNAWLSVMLAGRSVRPGWLSRLGVRLQDWQARHLDAEAVVLELLAHLGVAPQDHERFLERTVLQLPGWAGMFARLEHAPGPIGRSRARIALVDFLAVRLTLDLFAFKDIAARLGHRGHVTEIPAFCARLPRIAPPRVRGPHDTAWPIFHLAQFAGVAAPALREARRDTVDTILAFLDRLDESARLRLWHEAYEHNYRTLLLDAVAARLRSRPPPPPEHPRYQVMFCIDDRFESSRRHLEEIAPDVETFGAAGFFGLAIAYQGIDDPSTFPLCPVVVKPQHRIDEEPLTMQLNVAELRKARLREWGRVTTLFNKASRSLVLGLFVSILTGFLATIPLLLSVFAPRAAHRLRLAVRHKFLPEPKTRLTQGRQGVDNLPADQLHTGFSLDEKTTRVVGLLENIGLTKRFAPIVAVLGHDSASVNNPYFPAYSCGACGGRSGGPNARLFARMANQPEVRQRLEARGIHIPPETTFVGGVYDTANDCIRLFDAETLPPAARAGLPALEALLADMCKRNAHERCRRFASAPARPSPEQAQRHVEQRAVDLSQARPELGHATNASCFVGRRSLTQGLFLDRRAFLVSYDPSIDKAGAILERILLAVGPVGAGINLEYLFSTVDRERLGAGTKLPHNVTGLFGVMNGAASDLRTGLPTQMIEIHEPVRLHLVVEASTDTLLGIVERQPIVAELVKNEWIRVAAVDPATRRIHTFDARTGFQPYHPSTPDIPAVARSVDWYAGHDGFLAPARILAGGHATTGPHAPVNLHGPSGLITGPHPHVPAHA